MKVVILTFKISRKILAVSFLALLIPVLIIPANSETRDLFYVNDFTVSSSDVFIEDFTNKDYKDLSTTASGWGDGAITNTRNFSTSELDHYVLANPIVDIDVQGRKVYAAIHDETPGIDSIGAFYVNDPTNIAYTGGDNNWYYTKAVEANGDYLYAGQLAMGYSIVVHDLSNPFVPSSANGWGILDGFITDIEKDGHLIYFTNYNATSGFSLKILYAEDPLNLGLITCDWSSNQVLGLAVQGTTVYAAAGTEGFYVLNTTNKYTPIEMDHLPLPGNVTDVIVDGDVAYVAAGSAGVFTVDVRDPTNIAVMGHFDSPDNAIDLVKQGNTLFVADGASGVQVLDVIDPNYPTYVTDILLPYTYCVDLYGGVLVVGAEDGLYTYQICAGNGITNIEDHVFGNVFDTLEAWDVRVQGDIAIVAGGPDGLYTLNVRDPNDPILLDQDIIGGSPFYRKLDIRGDYAYVADFGTAFRVYDISDPTNIFQTDYRSLGGCTDVAISGDMAYLADGSAGVFIYNISDPYNVPSPFSSFDDAMVNITSVWVQGNTLYAVDYGVGGYNPSFYIYDMSDIDVEVQLSAVNRWDTHYDVKIDGDVAYLSTEVWLTTYDVSNPVIPIFGDDLEHDGGIIFSLGVWNFGPYVLSASGAQGVHLVDSTNIFSPGVDTQNYPDATGANQIITHGDYTYIANRSSLIILRHFESAADTYIPGAYFAQSLEVDSMALGEIKSATLDAIDFAPLGIPIDYYMSADGGNHWEYATPGVEHEFVFTGDDLRWKVEFVVPSYRSAHVFQIEINYEFNEAPSVPTLADLGDKALGTFKVDWSDSTDDVSVDHYVLQMSDTLSFTTIVKEWTATKSKQTVFLGKGTFYFRVQAIDNEGFPSPWSLVKQADTKLSTTIFGVILGGGLIVVILAIVIPLVLVRRKKKIPVR
jgi:hypothetical protein